MRGRILIEASQVFCILLDGNLHTLRSFEHLKIHSKTLRRILKCLETVPLFQIKSFKTNGENYTTWKCYFNKLDYKKIKLKECSRCGCVSFNPTQDFHKNALRVDGLQETCKKCKNQICMLFYYKNKKQINKIRSQKYKKKKLINS